MILLDSDVLVDILRGYEPAIEWLASVDGTTIALPGFAKMELYQGCQTKSQLGKVRSRLAIYTTLWPTPSHCELAADAYARVGLFSGAGMIDCLVAYTAIEHGLPLLTFNTKHYKSISELQTVQPYGRS